jgi:hypothetical protein
LDDVIVGEIEALLQKYKDVFACLARNWSKFPHTLFNIELDMTIPPIHYVKYRMNPIYVVVVK